MKGNRKMGKVVIIKTRGGPVRLPGADKAYRQYVCQVPGGSLIDLPLGSGVGEVGNCRTEKEQPNEVRKGMVDRLKHDGACFQVFHDGVTVFAEGCQVKGESLVLTNPVLTNGAQTKGVFERCPTKSDVYVFMRVIIPSNASDPKWLDVGPSQNTMLPVDIVSRAGKRGEFEELEAALGFQIQKHQNDDGANTKKWIQYVNAYEGHRGAGIAGKAGVERFLKLKAKSPDRYAQYLEFAKAVPGLVAYFQDSSVAYRDLRKATKTKAALGEKGATCALLYVYGGCGKGGSRRTLRGRRAIDSIAVEALAARRKMDTKVSEHCAVLSLDVRKLLGDESRLRRVSRAGLDGLIA